MPPRLEWLRFVYLKGKQQKRVPRSLRRLDERLSWLESNLSTRMVVASASATASARGQSQPGDCCRANQGARHVEFIDENGGGPGGRLRKRHQKKSSTGQKELLEEAASSDRELRSSVMTKS
jgi:hypothetical protein